VPNPSLPPQADDLSALAWVQSELRRSLENAHKALRRFLKESEAIGKSDVDAPDPGVLRSARAQIHQGLGALELVGLPVPARMLRAEEAAVQKLLVRPAALDEAAVQVIERASFALLDYIGRVLAGKPLSPVAMYPQYRDVQVLAGADRVHPADLWDHDWRWLELPPEAGIEGVPADDAAREVMESLVLEVMRTPNALTWSRISALCAGVAAGARGRSSTLWRLAAAFAEAQAGGLLPVDVHGKRVASRLLGQLRAAAKGQDDPSDRLAEDLLFFCAHARPASGPAPRLGLVRRVWSVEAQVPLDYETPRLGRFDPALILQARKRVAGAKDVWSAVAGGEAHRIGGLAEQFLLLGDSLQKLFPQGEVLSQALQAAAARTVAEGNAPEPTLAMEVATGVLYLDAILEDGELDHPELAERVQRLAQRIDDVRSGGEAQPLEPWMEELYRRVSDRQTMGSVVQELRASLSDAEKQIDQYFRNPSQRELLIPVPNQLASMRGVLSVLGMDQASAAVLHMRDDVDALVSTEVDPQRAAGAGTFDRLAENLGALSFLIDMLSVQPQLAKSLFRFDAAAGRLSAVMGRTERPSAFGDLDAVPAPEQARTVAGLPERTLADAPTLQMPRVSAPAQDSTVAMVAPAASAAPAAPVVVAAQAPASGLEDDDEMREVFIEEAGEVIASAREALVQLQQRPDDVSELTTIRRAFHTLKGSSRMVGLRDYGDAAWACEQLYNARLAQQPRLDNALQSFTAQALDYLDGWTAAEAARRDDGHRPPPVVAAADALRLEGKSIALTLPAAAPLPPVAAVIAAPAAAALPIELPPVERPAPAPAEHPAEPLVRSEPEPLPLSAAGPLAGALPALPVLALDDAVVAPSPADAAPWVQELPALVDMVAELPSPEDLDLRAPVAPAEAQASAVDIIESQPAAGADEVSFELDLGLGDAPAAPAPAVAPEAAVEAVELDFGVFEAEMGAAAPAAPEPDLVLPLQLDDALALSGPPPVVDLPVLVPEEPAAPAPLPLVDVIDLTALSEAGTAGPSDLPAVEPPTLPTASGAEQEAPGTVAPVQDDDEQVKIVGPLRIPIPLFNIYLNEADELSRRLAVELAEWGADNERRRVPESTVALSHSLAGNSATVGFADLSALARALEHALIRSRTVGSASPQEPQLFTEAAEEIRRLLHQFAAGFLRPLSPGLLDRLAEHERSLPGVVAGDLEPLEPDEPLPSVYDTLPLVGVGTVAPTFGALVEAPKAAGGVAASRVDAFDDEEDIDAQDAIDAELFPIFEEEAEELLPQLQGRLRDWVLRPSDRTAASACMRTLHTFKGGARLAGAMRLGEMAHRLETAVEHLAAQDEVAAAEVERLLTRADNMSARFDTLRKPKSQALPVETADAAAAKPPPQPQPVEIVAADIDLPMGDAPALSSPMVPVPTDPGGPAVVMPAINWSAFGGAMVDASKVADRSGSNAGAAVRVRSGLLDRLVNHAGEVSITRARIDTDVRQLQSALNDLTDNLDRMRRQLRDIEVQAESQISSRMEAAKAASQAFDPLEMDRFTRFQELTRMMAESVNDVATVQRSVQRTLQSTEDELAAQTRLTRELQEDLLRTRMVEFESLADRLYRVVRQAAKDTAKQVRLDIVGGAIEVDRSVLERMVGPFEHLLRNCVAHGIESPQSRAGVGKEATGSITMSVAQEGNEVSVEVRDDGGGLDLGRIRKRAQERGILAADQQASDAELANMIFMPGFSTASDVTELSGRGVGLDVVRSEVGAMGGRIETASTPGQGTSFRLLLPLTTAVTQVVMLRCGELRVAVPSTLIEVVRRVPSAEVERAYLDGAIAYGDQALPFYWLAALLQGELRGPVGGRSQAVVVVRSAAQRVVVHVDEVVGNQEVVVKHVGPQLSRLPGLAGVTLLPSGAIALIYNPVALAALYGEAVRQRAARPQQPVQPAQAVEPAAVQRAPLVLVVDDSLTVRRVTQRLLLREGFRVALAKDGMEALERLAEERPAVMLSDIEMPRMDGFDLVRNVRAEPTLHDLPVIMITSRIAQKHRDYAAELGVPHYLGKPFSEDELLTLVARYAGADITV